MTTLAEHAMHDVAVDPERGDAHRRGRIVTALDSHSTATEQERRAFNRRTAEAHPACAPQHPPMKVHSGYRAMQLGYVPCVECFPGDDAWKASQ